MVDLTPYTAQITRAMRDACVSECNDPRTAFINELTSYGFEKPTRLEVNGIIGRVGSPLDIKKGQQSGWYWYKELEVKDRIIGVASFGDWKDGSKHQWSSKSQRTMSLQEKSAYQEAQDLAHKAAELEQERRYGEAAKRALNIYQNAAPARPDAKYLLNKKITPCPLIRETFVNDPNGELIIPVTRNGELSSLQFIKNEGSYTVNGNSIGNKRMMKGGRQKGCCLYIAGNNDIVYICEGYATGRSLSMATGNTVCVTFSSTNMYNVASTVKDAYQKSIIIVAGDDDIDARINTGREKAEHVASSLGLDIIFPLCGGDFNDMHNELGLNELSRYLKPQSTTVSNTTQRVIHNDDIIIRPSGVLGNMFDYYNATSGAYQPGFAVQTALAICSVWLARSYRSSSNNYSSLFFLCIGKTATGKEHIKTVIEELSSATGNEGLIVGEGYTAPGAVMSELLYRPAHIAAIDELGLYLEACKGTNGNSQQKEAVSTLMQAITRCGSVIRAKSYSTMGMKKEMAEMTRNRYVHNPGLSLIGATTPGTFFKAVDISAIESGFLNRFLTYASDTKRALRRDCPDIEVPDRIIDWARVINERSDTKHVSSEKVDPIIITFTNDAKKTFREYEQHCIDLADSLEDDGLSNIVVRQNEWAMRIALICSLSRNPMTDFIEKEDAEWAIYWSKLCSEKNLKQLRMHISHSGFEGDKKEVLEDLRNRGEKGITWSRMMKINPYAKHKPKDLKNILNALKDADAVYEEVYAAGRGRPTTLWKAV